MPKNTDCRFCLNYGDCEKKPSENVDVKACSGFTHFLTPLQDSLAGKRIETRPFVKAGEYAII